MKFKKVMTIQGVPIYAYHIPHAKSATITVLVKAGARDELRPKEAGLAHAMEHMVFRGTEDFPDGKDLAAYIEHIGGLINATTSKECTKYYSCVPSGHIERAIYSLSQMIRKPLLRAEDIKLEMKVVAQETLSYQDNLDESVIEEYLKEVFNGHPLAFGPLGLKKSVLNFRKTDFERWKNKFHHPNNLVFFVTGNFKIEKIKKLFEKYFPENIRSKIQKSFIVPEQPVKKYTYIPRDTKQAHVVFGTITPKAEHPDNWPLEVFETMIDGGSSSPLFQEIREKRGLAYSVGAKHWIYNEASIFTIGIETDPHKVKEAIKVSLEVIKKSKNSVTLMNIAKEIMIGKLILSSDDREDVLSAIIDDLNTFNKAVSLKEKIKKIRSVTIQQISKVVEKYLLDENRRVIVILGPKKSK